MSEIWENMSQPFEFHSSPQNSNKKSNRTHLPMATEICNALLPHSNMPTILPRVTNSFSLLGNLWSFTDILKPTIFDDWRTKTESKSGWNIGNYCQQQCDQNIDSLRNWYYSHLYYLIHNLLDGHALSQRCYVIHHCIHGSEVEKIWHYFVFTT